MESILTRKEKIRLLSALKVGKIGVDALKSNNIYFFSQSNLKEGLYELGRKQLNQEEYDFFCMNVRSRNDNSIIWNEYKTYENRHKIIRH